MAYPQEKVHELIAQCGANITDNGLYDVYINSLISAMVSFDEALFDKYLSNVFIRFGIYDSVVKIVYPFLQKTGVLWNITNVVPAQEHFASNIVRRKLLSAIDGLPYGIKKDKKFLLFLPAGEWHEIGLLFADYIIRGKGYETIYLGQNLPYSNLALAIETTKPTHLVTFFSGWTDISENITKLAALNLSIEDAKILICVSNQFECPVNVPTKISFLNEPDDIFGYL